jgi:hypothetical protein
MLLPAILLALAPAPQAATPPQAPREKLVCRKQDTTGSRLASQKICMTKAQWEERTRTDERTINNLLKVACSEERGNC